MSEKKTISELPQNTVKLITATQIATSVSNIVKELVENSLDAGSTVIRVKTENGGLTKIEVFDNGSGVSKDNVSVMALPHFTSKISEHKDLESLITYGFRGEALAAICAVGKLSITTRTDTDEVASVFSMDSCGKIVDVKPSHMGQGTQVVVSQLFYNVPVRKQYFQTPRRKKDEIVKVEELLLSYGLIHPELHLSFHNDHRLIWQKSRATDFNKNILQTLGHSISSHMEFISEEETIKLFLMIPKRGAPTEICFRHRSDRCFTFINQRPVVSKEIEKLMKELYGSVQDPTSKTTLYPMYIISLQFPGDEIDVNLEPNKTQILMKRQSEVLELIKNKVNLVLGNDKEESRKQMEEESSPPQIGTTSSLANEGTYSAKQTENVNNRALEKNGKEVEQRLGDLQTLEDRAINELLGDSSLQPVQFEDSNADMSFDIFNGFSEPFSTDTEVSGAKQIPEGPITVGSAEWCQGLAKDANGRFIHPVEVLRGGPHFAKRITEPPLSGGLSKKPRIAETEEALKIVGPSQRKFETVNGKVRSLPSDPYEEYCKVMKPELLSQNPIMTFTELTQHLSQGWKNLNKSSREQYETKAEVARHRYSTKLRNEQPPAFRRTSLDRFLCSETPVVRASTFVSNLTKSVSVGVECSMAALVSSGARSCSTKDKWNVVCKMNKGPPGWICSNGNEIMAINFLRLYEMILYSRLSSSQMLASKLATNPIIINPTILANTSLWELLNQLPAEWESTSSKIITDHRITANGLAIRLCTGPTGVVSYAQVFKVPMGMNHFDIGDVLKLLERLSKEYSTVESCRPDHLKKSFKVEAARLAAERCNEPDEEEVCQLLQQWCDSYQENVCLHGEPVVWHYVLQDEDEDEDDMGDMLFDLDG